MVMVMVVVMVGLWGNTGVKVKAGFGIGRIEKVRKRVCGQRKPEVDGVHCYLSNPC